MAKMLLWIEIQNETMLEKIAEVDQKERELTEAVRQLKRFIDGVQYTGFSSGEYLKKKA